MPPSARATAKPPQLAQQNLDLSGAAAHSPLAARMRPQTLDEFVGQEHLVGERGALRRMIDRGHLTSMVLWGPPGSGKTTLARLLAEAVDAPFATLSAVMSGVADVRGAIARAREWIDSGGRSTVLFIDEIHRFNKSQQDALLPQVEDGTITLIGATTENPYFEVNSALLSRLRVFRLEPLADDQVRAVVERAMADPRGLGGRVALNKDALDHLVDISGGDARSALNVIESAAAMAGADAEAADAPPAGSKKAAVIKPTLEEIEAAAQQRVLSYDRAGDGHYDTVSAFIKSLRGNDPDAALYWLATMVAAGEDPRFIVRRLIISASEDVGNADPHALQLATSAAYALDWVGLPEAQFALAQATAYIAAAPKSNRAGWRTGRPWMTCCATGRCPCPATCEVPPGVRSATSAPARATPIRTTSRAPMSTSSTCPTTSRTRIASTTDPRTTATRRTSPSGWRPGANGAKRTTVSAGRCSSPGHVARRDAMKVSGNVMAQREQGKRTIAAKQKREAAKTD